MLRTLVPSMFHRRLLLLFAVVVVSVSAVGAQLIRLTIVQGDQRLADAERVLSTTRLLPTVRGTIYDSRGRLLAVDVPCNDIQVDFDVISGEWAYNKARRKAYDANEQDWAEMSFDRREAAIATARSEFDEAAEDLWTAICVTGGIDREELEARRASVVRRVQAIKAAVWDRQSERRALESGGPVELGDIATIRVAEEEQPHTLLPAVGEEVRLYFEKRADELPGVHVEQGKRRDQPLHRVALAIDRSTLPQPIQSDKPLTLTLNGVCDHVLGSMRRIYREDVTYIPGLRVDPRPYRRPDGTVDRGGYLPGDRRGSRGVEAAAERRLRGERGLVVYHRDTQVEDVEPASPGRDVQLTIDAHLQARCQALLRPETGLAIVQPWHRNDDLPLGTPLNGSIVVLDVDTAEVLAMVTSPADMNADLDDDDWPDRLDQPVVNRPIAAIYPPGSTLKPIVYAIAARDGAIQWDQSITCNGHLFDDKPNRYRCWGWRPTQGKFHHHGPVGPVQAIAVSCNIYFYTCGQRLGHRRLVEGLYEFGYGASPGTGLAGENDGYLPSLDGDNPAGRGLSDRNAIFTGIGQGPIAATPLQVAAAHATLARGGYHLSPIVMRHTRQQQVARDLRIPPRVIDNVLQGMFDSANDTRAGTGSRLVHEDATGNRTVEPICNLDGVVVRSKTGTAQAPTRFEDVNRNGRLDEGEPILRRGSHAWFVYHAGLPDEDRARYIVVVLMEYGGSGGRVGGPIANQVLHALRAEGRL